MRVKMCPLDQAQLVVVALRHKVPRLRQQLITAGDDTEPGGSTTSVVSTGFGVCWIWIGMSL